MSSPTGEWKTPHFVVNCDTDGSLWVRDADGGQDDGWLLVPDDGLDDLINALQAAREARR